MELDPLLKEKRDEILLLALRVVATRFLRTGDEEARAFIPRPLPPDPPAGSTTDQPGHRCSRRRP